mmetsp:Transcript_34734/g.56090  ORF Transcript_34734/g.56090 Transcript_34734/m.56090 type:complete len:231 (+) Transcript_34734:331-1023(+)
MRSRHPPATSVWQARIEPNMELTRAKTALPVPNLRSHMQVHHPVYRVCATQATRVLMAVLALLVLNHTSRLKTGRRRVKSAILAPGMTGWHLLRACFAPQARILQLLAPSQTRHAQTVQSTRYQTLPQGPWLTVFALQATPALTEAHHTIARRVMLVMKSRGEAMEPALRVHLERTRKKSEAPHVRSVLNFRLQSVRAVRCVQTACVRQDTQGTYQGILDAHRARQEHSR